MGRQSLHRVPEPDLHGHGVLCPPWVPSDERVGPRLRSWECRRRKTCGCVGRTLMFFSLCSFVQFCSRKIVSPRLPHPPAPTAGTRKFGFEQNTPNKKKTTISR